MRKTKKRSPPVDLTTEAVNARLDAFCERTRGWSSKVMKVEFAEKADTSVLAGPVVYTRKYTST